MMSRCLGVMVLSGCIAMAPGQIGAAGQPTGTEKITKEARDTIEATKEYTAQQKEAFQRKTQEELVLIQKQISALQGTVGKASEATRAELQQSIADLERKKDAAKNKLEELRSATDAKWTDVKSGVSAALNDLKQSYRKALSHLP